ncbi:MAG: radical SAM family heme chaperone HemW [Oscillospiraceae bacterium]|jgi:putative oxygen-independent coproporphyrinogen III oxidase
MEQKTEPMARKPLGLYIHIPFCRQKCHYCDFYSFSGQEAKWKPYYKALLAHIEEAAQFTPQHALDTIYFGGGTPSFFPTDYLTAILKAIQTQFHVLPDAEITVEANPDSAALDSLSRLRQAGFNRISIGMQAADDKTLSVLGRPHTFSQTQEAVQAARDAGFENLSLDLMYGLPAQTQEHWKSALQAAVSLHPDHLSCYGLKVEEKTPFYAQQSRLALPDDDLQADFYLYCVHFLNKAGYGQYEVSNFAKPGFASRHNLKYWTLEEYIGLGPGAHSDFGGYRYSFLRDLDAYIEGVQKGASLLDECEFLPKGKRHGEYLMLRLRTASGISEGEYARPHAMEFAPVLELLKQYESRGWAVLENGRWRFTPMGFLLSNQLIGLLLDSQRHLPVGFYATPEPNKEANHIRGATS